MIIYDVKFFFGKGLKHFVLKIFILKTFIRKNFKRTSKNITVSSYF